MVYKETSSVVCCHACVSMLFFAGCRAIDFTPARRLPGRVGQRFHGRDSAVPRMRGPDNRARTPRPRRPVVRQ